MKSFCPNCERTTDQQFIETKKQLKIRDINIPILLQFYHCNDCGEDYEKPNKDYDPLAIAYSEYRRIKKFLQPEEIKEKRKALNLTQQELSEILGIGVATLNRYENGALQTEAHDRMIRLCLQPQNLAKIIKENSNFDDEKQQNLLKHLVSIINPKDELVSLLIHQYSNYPINEYCGKIAFNVNKLFQSIKFFCYDTRVYKTKLMKLLFYSDFLNYKIYDHSITGAKYANAPNGPILDNFDIWLTVLKDVSQQVTSTEVQIKFDECDFSGEVYTSTPPDFSVFEAQEIVVLSFVKDRFRKYSAKQISEYSHREMGYTETKSGQIISYNYAKQLSLNTNILT